MGRSGNVDMDALYAEAQQHGDVEILDYEDTYVSLPEKVCVSKIEHKDRMHSEIMGIGRSITWHKTLDTVNREIVH